MTGKNPTNAPKSTVRNNAARAAAAGALTAALLGIASPAHAVGAPADPTPPPAATVAAAHDAAAAPATLDTLSRFFARDGAVAPAKAKPRIEGSTVPVYTLAPEFVAGKAGAPVGSLDFLASKAVSADGQKASVWTVRTGDTWKVVNIATGDDETRYAAEGTARLGGGTVFREPQIDAWYVRRGDRVLPLDADATRAIGAEGTTLDRYRERVHQAYGDKLPGSAYAKKGQAGGYGEQDAPADARAEARVPAEDGGGGPLTTASAATAAGALLTLGAAAVAGRRLRRR
ncbi:hypothetical protein [Streptomyces netropsis]|uniref:Gram-positive cocci surface proteins LPxTG domain-containing protein n=1 Tax=Streptomyces netropsis TaxID=55404 RepID=A0A7W7PCC4_STRNE|nr:hypothetical protein [Streptomyces netropsis]MBB4884869.1 hypothetical protein [Streptomyces netropsis]GGR00737.1 hypothetical protein GCM10010219_00360 [Streptomyces netropsis]